MLLLGTASGPAVTRSNQLTDQKRRNCEAVVEQVFALLEAKTHTRQIMTKKVSSGNCLIPRQTSLANCCKFTLLSCKTYQKNGHFLASWKLLQESCMSSTNLALLPCKSSKILQEKLQFCCKSCKIISDSCKTFLQDRLMYLSKEVLLLIGIIIVI